MSDATECNYCLHRRLKRKYGERLVEYKGSFYEKGAAPGPGQRENALEDGTPIRFLAWYMELPSSCRC
jgi:hypothetical protein